MNPELPIEECDCDTELGCWKVIGSLRRDMKIAAKAAREGSEEAKLYCRRQNERVWFFIMKIHAIREKGLRNEPARKV